MWRTRHTLTKIVKVVAGESMGVRSAVFTRTPSLFLDFSVERAGGLRSMVFGGEGLFLATLRGTGRIWLQSLPARKLIQNLSSSGPNAGKESGGILGNLFER